MASTAQNGFILVVDDTPANLEVISEALTDAGYEVAAALSGDRALKQVQHRPPDLILLDIQMPGIDGFETCRQLKQTAATAEIPIIFMTALSDAESKIKAFALGAVDYVTKPFQEAEILARVATHLKLSQLAQSLEALVAERTAELAKRTDELTVTLADLRRSQLKLIQQEKFSALGTLIAGIAHEVNNPVSFIIGNLKPAQEHVQDLLKILELYQEHFPNPGNEITEEIDAIELDFVREDLPKLLTSMQAGADRIRTISRGLRTFSRADGDSKTLYDLHEGIESTLMILNHRLKANAQRVAIKVTKNYGHIPKFECFAGQINQVFMNLLSNAIDALEEAIQKGIVEKINASPEIGITTYFRTDSSTAFIHIKDNGIGIPESLQSRIFEHFTTKPIGKGTGLGMSIVHQIVVENYQGTIKVQSMPNQGAEFIIQLPLRGSSAPVDDD